MQKDNPRQQPNKAVRTERVQNVIDDYRLRKVPLNYCDLTEFVTSIIHDECAWWESRACRKEYYRALVARQGLSKHNRKKKAHKERLHLGLQNKKNWKSATSCNAPSREYRVPEEMQRQRAEWKQVEDDYARKQNALPTT